MKPYIDEYLIELNGFPRYGETGNLFTIKDYFYCNSNNLDYGNRGTVVPTKYILNKEDLPEESVIKSIINNKEPVMKRVIDLNNQTENWVFVPTEETNK
jgi:hypothetical protein